MQGTASLAEVPLGPRTRICGWAVRENFHLLPGPTGQLFGCGPPRFGRGLPRAQTRRHGGERRADLCGLVPLRAALEAAPAPEADAPAGCRAPHGSSARSDREHTRLN